MMCPNYCIWSARSHRRNISPSAGLKQSFGQAYHRAGEAYRIEETHNIVTPLAHFFRDTHFFRQDVDEYLVKTAIHYGVDYRDRTNVTGIAFDDEGVSVTTEAGECFRARYFVDGAGFRSPLAEQLGLRDQTRAHAPTVAPSFATLRRSSPSMTPSPARSPAPIHSLKARFTTPLMAAGFG